MSKRLFVIIEFGQAVVAFLFKIFEKSARLFYFGVLALLVHANKEEKLLRVVQVFLVLA